MMMCFFGAPTVHQDWTTSPIEHGRFTTDRRVRYFVTLFTSGSPKNDDKKPSHTNLTRQEKKNGSDYINPL